MPAAWQATAICEEGGRDDPHAGYFGILEWNGFDGYPTAGSAPLSVQLAWEAGTSGSHRRTHPGSATATEGRRLGSLVGAAGRPV